MAKRRDLHVVRGDSEIKERCESLLLRSLEHLERVQDSLDAGLDEIPPQGMHRATAAESARIAGAIATVTSELRARAKAEAKLLEAIPVRKALARLRILSPDELERAIAELQTVNSNESVLS